MRTRRRGIGLCILGLGLAASAAAVLAIVGRGGAIASCQTAPPQLPLSLRPLESTAHLFRVTAGAGGRVYVTTSDGLDQFTDMDPASRRHAPLKLNAPNGVAVDARGAIYVAESYCDRILKMNSIEGDGLQAVGASGGGAGQFSLPADIAVDARGRLYVADSSNDRIVRVNNMGGAGWISLGHPGSGWRPPRTHEFYFPLGIAVDSAGRIYVADTNNGRIVRIDNDMSWTGWTVVGTKGSGPYQFDAPIGIAVDVAGRIYVADSGNRRIVRMDDMTGAGWATLGNLAGPEGVAVDAAGRIYIADRYRLLRVNDVSGEGSMELSFPEVR